MSEITIIATKRVRKQIDDLPLQEPSYSRQT